VDAHEDISYLGVVLRRNFLSFVQEVRAREGHPNPQVGTATIGLPELMEANVRVVFGSI